MKQYIHNTPGRLRVKTTYIKRNKKLAKHAEKFIYQINGVKSVSANTTTGSIVIIYDIKTIKSNTVLNILKESGFIKNQQMTTQVNKTHTKIGEFVGKFLFGLAIETILGRNFISFVITALILF